MSDTLEPIDKFYRELRCPKCHKLICEEFIYQGRIRFNCPRCDEITTYNFTKDYKQLKADKSS